MTKVHYYFAYGPAKNSLFMRTLTGNDNLNSVPATLDGYSLHKQNLDQVTDEKAAPHLPSPREALARTWGQTYTTTVLVPDEKGTVSGVLWVLKEMDRQTVKDWQLVELGWNKDSEVYVNAPSGKKLVETEIISPGQKLGEKLGDEIFWPTHPIEFLAKARRAGMEFREEYQKRSGERL